MARRLWTGAAALAILAAAGPSLAAEPTPLSEIQVVARAGDDDDLGERVVSAAEIARSGDLALQGALARTLPGATLTDVQGNGFARDLTFRGFDASASAGRPQGLAVYQGGARLNEPFGDTVHFDLVPEIAVSGAELQTQSPAYGLNALGGALTLKMKSGFSGAGGATLRGGSFGRVFGAAEGSRAWGDSALYVAAEGGRDAGWRLHSPSQIARAFGDLAWRRADSEARLSLTAADNRLTAIGPTPADLLARDRRAVFTWPQTTRDQALLASLSGRTAAGGWTVSANLYARRFDQAHADGNGGEFEGCSGNPANPLFATLCLENDAFPAPRPPAAAFQVQTLAGAPVACPPRAGTARPCAGVPYGTIDRARTGSTTLGGGAEASRLDRAAGLEHGLTAGVAFTASRSRFSSDSELALIRPDLSVGPAPGLPGSGALIRTAGALAYSPVGVQADTDTLGGYFADTLSLPAGWSLALSGRYDAVHIRVRDLTGASPALDGDHRFGRFNPGVTLAWRPVDGLRLYGGYAEASRAPTPLELGCSDPDRPCLLENALVADPPLKPVVARSFEAGLKAERLADGRLSLGAVAFAIDSDDDILALPSAIQGRGSYANVPRTRRRGLELEAQWRAPRLEAYANWGLVEATYRFAGALPSPNAPFADADGLVHVRPGDRIGGIAPQTFKAGLEAAAGRRGRIGADLVALAPRPLVGDEAGQDARLPGYAVVAVHAAYDVTARATLFARIANLTDSRAASYGAYVEQGSLADVAGAPALSDPRTLTPLEPRAFEAGLTLRW